MANKKPNGTRNQSIELLIALTPKGLKLNTALVTKSKLNRFDFAEVRYRKQPTPTIVIHFVKRPSMKSIPLEKTPVGTISVSCRLPFQRYAGLYVPTELTEPPPKEKAFVIEPSARRWSS